MAWSREAQQEFDAALLSWAEREPAPNPERTQIALGSYMLRYCTDTVAKAAPLFNRASLHAAMLGIPFESALRGVLRFREKWRAVGVMYPV